MSERQAQEKWTGFFFISSFVMVVLAYLYYPVTERSNWRMGYPDSLIISALIINVCSTLAYLRLMIKWGWEAKEIRMYSIYAFLWGPFPSLSLLCLLNGIFDTGSYQVRNTTILRMDAPRSRSKTSYTLYVSDWKMPTKTIQVDVPASLYRSTHVGANFKVVTSPGALGWEIIRSKGD